MDIKEIKTDGLTRTYSVTVPKEDLAERLNAKIAEMQPQVRLKGFRPGKVPTSHIRKMFGQSIMRDVVEDTLNETSQAAISDNKLRPAGQPKIDLRANGEDVTNGKADLEYQMTVETIPDFEVSDIKDYEFERFTTDVDDAEIEDRLKQLSEGRKTYKKKAKTAKAKEGDAVLIDFVGKIDGEPFEGGSMEGHQLVLGSGSFIPGFEDQLVGVKAGDEKNVEVTFPENYQAEQYAGKAAIFEVKVHEVQGAKDAEVDDDFAKTFGMDDLDKLKEAIKESAEAEYSAQSRMKLKRAILDKLDEQHKFDLPSGMVEQEFNAIWQQVLAEKEAGNLDDEDAAKSDEDLEADYRKIAERRVRLGLVLAEMGQRKEIQITNEELQRALIAEARKYPGQEKQVIEFFQKNPAQLAQLRAPIYEEKVVDHIINTAKVTDKAVKKDVLFEDDPMI